MSIKLVITLIGIGSVCLLICNVIVWHMFDTNKTWKTESCSDNSLHVWGDEKVPDNYTGHVIHRYPNHKPTTTKKEFKGYHRGTMFHSRKGGNSWVTSAWFIDCDCDLCKEREFGETVK
jgi:hypothetical protein